MDMDGLDLKLPLHKELSEKYQIPVAIVAYIRSALLRPDHKYDKQSLMYHITEENIMRREEITKLRYSVTLENADSIRKQTTNIQKNLDLRQGALAVLRTASDSELSDLLRLV